MDWEAQVMPMRRGQLEILVELNEITGPAGSERLEPQAIAVLALLAGEPGRVWSRDELLQKAWQGRIVSDATLSGVISRLRRSLQAAGVSDARIETVSKRGYVFDRTLTAPARRRLPLPGRIGVAVVFGVALSLVLAVAWRSSVWRPQITTLDGVRLDFSITLPDGSEASPAIWLDEGHEGELRQQGDYPLSIRVLPAVTADGLLRLRFEARSVAHWTGFEQTIALDTESRFRLGGEHLAETYDIRFVASLADRPATPQEIPR